MKKIKTNVANFELFGQSYNDAKQRNQANKDVIKASKAKFREFYYSLNELSRGFLEVAKTDRNSGLLLLDALKIKVSSFNAQNIAKEVAQIAHKEVVKLIKANFQASENGCLVRKIWDIPKQMYHFENIIEFRLNDVYKAIENARNNKNLPKVKELVYYGIDSKELSEAKAAQMLKDYKIEQQEKETQLQVIEEKKEQLYNDYIAEVAKGAKVEQSN